MAEFKVGPGRYLVSANMGKGYEQYNEPRRAVEYMKSNVDNLHAELKGTRVQYKGFDSWLDANLAYLESFDLQERSNTADAELLWLAGNTEYAHTLAGRGGQVNG